MSWNLSIPDDLQAVQYKVIAKSGAFSDGEQNGVGAAPSFWLARQYANPRVGVHSSGRRGAGGIF